MAFAKLYNMDIGQILVKLDTDPEKDHMPELRIYFEPAGLGVCSIAYQFNGDDEDEKWDQAEKAFDEMTEDKALDIVSHILEGMEQ